MGRPLITYDVEALTECLSFAPGYHACILGPVPFGQPPEARVRLTIGAIIVPTREEAESACWAHVHDLCDTYGHKFDEDEWEIEHILAVNCS